MASEVLRIGPPGDADVGEPIELAGSIWRRHYPDIIGRAQIDYMLAQGHTPELIRERTRRDDTRWDKATLEGRMFGYARYELDGTAMRLDKLCVHPDHHRRGYGARIEAVARRRRAASVRLNANQRNSSSIAAYRKNGCAIVASVVADIGGGFVMHGSVMEKRL